MTISSTVSKNTYIADGLEDAFAFNFAILDDSNLLVSVVNSTGTLQDQTLGVHYTVSGVGNNDELTNFTSGTVTFEAAYIPAEDDVVIIRRVLDLTQETLYSENDPFPAKTHEAALDKLTLITQQLQEQVDRSFKTEYTNEDTTDLTLPIPEAGQYLRWNSTEDGLENAVLTSIGGITEVLSDPSPDLGGDLNVNGNRIISVSNGDIVLDPHGTGIVDLISPTLSIDERLQHRGDSDTALIFTTDNIQLDTGGSSRLDVSNSGFRLGAANARVTTILDEDDMASNSPTALATQQSIKAYVDNTSIALATPLLGGNLDLDGYKIITNDSNENIELDPHNSGSIILTVDSGGTVQTEGPIHFKGDANNSIAFSSNAQTYSTGGTSRLDINNSGVRLGGSGARVTSILDEDDMTSNSATAIPTQQSTKAYVDTSIAALPTVASQSDMETATSITSAVTPGRAQYHPGVAKFWAFIDPAASPDSLVTSYNIASMTINTSNQEWRLTFSTPMSSANYIVLATHKETSGTGAFTTFVRDQTSTYVDIRVSNTSSEGIYVVGFGDF